MDWQQILAIVIPPLIAALGGLVPVLLAWLKKQKWVEQAHLEDFFSALLPQVFEWVEYWAEHLYEPKFGKKPTSEMKMAKAIEMVKTHLPKHVVKTMTDEAIRLRLEHTIKKNGTAA
jgi:hypothetical protein